ncbi:hypothetical protein [Echinimonas agarilytica]|uniref:Uncharacterized protein n=1 Tax=Echinimonas agarilytica TaxID=1215918 RepID=A0AA41W4P1_9GAMM|nr:hypothetical protein [Echinimonas agarilytica]MCM2678736.1 hypothetical protein [Echinimonas agarilytica]
MLRITMFIILMIVTAPTVAGKVVVRKSSDPEFDPWALKKELIQHNAWQESMRQQHILNWVYSLPAGCYLYASPYRYYGCGGQYWRPYEYQNKQIFVEIDAPANAQSDPIIHTHKPW